MNWNLYKTLMRLPYMVRLFFLIVSITIFFGTILHYLEPKEYPTIFDGIWWAAITVSTVGYGDYAPETFSGRIIAMVLILLGAGFVVTFFGTIAKNMIQEHNAITKGTAPLKEKNHYIIIGWNERTKAIMANIMQTQEEAVITLIDSSLQFNSFPNARNIYFIKGAASSDEVLHQANLSEAKLVLITADPEKNEFDADMHTILNIVAIKGLAPHVFCIAEILTENQKMNAIRAGADKIVQTNSLSGEIMLQTMRSRGVADDFLDIGNVLEGAKLENQIVSELHESTFGEVLIDLAKENKILLGIKRGAETMINPSHEILLQKGDQLLVLGKYEK